MFCDWDKTITRFYIFPQYTITIPLNILCFMNSVTMFLQVLRWRTCFATWVTFVTFAAIMNSLNVFLQIWCERKWYSTIFTFVILGTFMNCMDVFLQISCTAWENDLPPDSHLWSLWPSWTVLVWVFNFPTFSNKN